MAEIPQPIKAGITPAKIKTKAKARYLRRKKLRRKAQKSSAPRAAGVAHASSPSEEDEEADGGKSKGAIVIELPKKKRKIADQGFSDIDVASDTGETADLGNKIVSPTKKSLPKPGTLPSFPSPTIPSALPRSLLAIQGIDKALIHAEVIDPTAITLLSTTGQDNDTCLGWKTRKRLFDLGISELFAVQTALLPFLICRNHSLYTPYSTPRDVCVSAPTGSGKTLAYVLPILEVLSNRIVTRLRALIVLPTRDLVTQVRETFEAVSKGRGLKIGAVTGQHSFAHEQAQLVSETDSGLLGGSSKVDILICTPGRLIDHLNETPNFSLQHLRFLVIDEADRLLSQSFQDWLAQVLAAIHWTPVESIPAASELSLQDHFQSSCDSLAPACLDPKGFRYLQADVSECRTFSCQKLLFSATLTRDPGKLASLGLRDPKYFVVQSSDESGFDGTLSHVERFAMPATLTEHMVVCEPSQKPLMLLHLLHNLNLRNALIFTKSSESTTRLVFLLRCFEELRAPECTRITACSYSSDLPASERKSILQKFKAQEVHALICSDLISRGIDINHVSHVINYDTPVDMRKYVHRVGRTARAGRDGEAWTLVEEQEARYFKTMLKEHDHIQKVRQLKVRRGETQSLLESYQVALRQLREAYSR